MQTKITDEDLEGLEKVLEANTGAAELTPVKLDKADWLRVCNQVLARRPLGRRAFL